MAEYSRSKLSEAFLSLADLVTTLRGPKGCPWDAGQTDDTIKDYLLEEAYEVVQAVEGRSGSGVCEELGDLLFQILFLSELAGERGEFDILRVVEKITDKMVRRHPHVFGSATVESPEEVAANWARIKQAEKEETHASRSRFSAIPRVLPALLAAHRLNARAEEARFVPRDREASRQRVERQFEAMRLAAFDENSEGLAEAMGDLFFALAGMARQWGLNAETLLRMTNRREQRRFLNLEQELRNRGLRIRDATASQVESAKGAVQESERG